MCKRINFSHFSEPHKDQMKDLYNTIVESDVKVQALLQTREGLKGIDMDVYKSNTGRAAKEFFT